MFNLVLFNPEIPQNTGNIGRLAVSNNCHLHLIKPLGFVISDAEVRRAGLDYWRFLKLTIHDSWETFVKKELTECTRFLFLSTRGKKNIYDYEYQKDDYLIFGSESKGLEGNMYKVYKDSLYQIPMYGEHSRSLNIANSVAITLYEGLRQISQCPN